MKKIFATIGFLFIFALFFVPTSASAATYYHDGVGTLSDSSSWWDTPAFDGTNGTLPSGELDVGIIQNTITVSAGSPTIDYSLIIDSGGAVNVTSADVLTITSGGTSGGSINVNSGGILTVNTSGTLTVDSGGTLNVNNSGTLTVDSGGTLNQYNASWAIDGTVNLNNSQTISSGYAWAVNGSGALAVASGGTLTVASGGTLSLNTTSSLTVASGGTLTFDYGASFIQNQATWSIVGTVNIFSTGLSIDGGFAWTVNNGGVLNLNSTGALVINGGTLTVDSGGTFNVNCGTTLTNNGGTLNNAGIFNYAYFANSGTFSDTGTSTDISGTCPTVPGTPDLQTASDTGSSSTDNATNDTTPTFDVSCTGADVVEIHSPQGTLKGSATCSGGNATTTSSALTTGSYTFYARAGNGTATTTYSAGLSITIDTTAPTISSVATSTTQTTATITWTTNEAATSTIDFGLTSSYGTASSSSATTTSHSYTLTGLTASTVYHYRISNRDTAGNLSTTTDATFTTASPAVSSSGGFGTLYSGGSTGGGGGGSPSNIVYINGLPVYVNPTTGATSTASATTTTTSTLITTTNATNPLCPIGYVCVQNNSNNNSNLCTVPIYLTKAIKLGGNNNTDDVKLLENFLNIYEGYSLPVNGVYEVNDFNAVVKFQEKYASDVLTPVGSSKGTGYVSIYTLKKIKEIVEGVCKKTAQSSNSLASVSTSVNPNASDSVNSALTQGITSYKFLKNLTQGDNSSEVTRLQLFLNTQGFNISTTGLGSPGNESTYFGLKTLNALKRFQSTYSISPVSGYFGPITRNLINARGWR